MNHLLTLATCALAAALLSACQESSDAEPTTATTEGRKHALAAPASWIAIPAQPDALLQGLVIPADAATRGMWSASKPWPFNAIHSVLLSDGRLLTFGTPFGNPAAQDGRYYDVWSPELGFANSAHAGSITPDAVNSFCGMAGWLADGSLLVAGGNGGGGTANYGKTVGTFSLANYKTTQNALSMAAERWYATMVALPDARQLVIGGTVPYVDPITSQTPEILENGSWRSLFGAASTPMFGVRRVDNQPESNPWYYPRAWVAPDGKVFGITSKYMFRLDPDANNRAGAITQIGTFKTVQDGSGATTPNVGFTSTAVMYAPGRILQVGGNGTTDNNGLTASLNASIIDINGAVPVVTETAPMRFRRHWANANVLPDGKVVVTGGSVVGWDPANAVRPAEIWNPATGTWTVGASAVETRTYHSSSVLLPNGTVFTGGGGAPGVVNNSNAEIYYPPYLFTTANGAAQLAARPAITALSALTAAYGATLGIEMNDMAAVSRLVLIQTGTTTHSFNTTQRFVPLNFTQNGSTLSATLPASGNLAPPGYYMVFALNAAGVPSRGVMISLGGLKAPTVTPAPLPNALPTGAVACAAENGTCTLPGGMRGTVYYGGGGIFASRAAVTGSLACTNGVFGDPAPGVIKQCHYLPEGPANTSYCAAAGANCAIPAGYTGNVSYGANGNYVTATGLTGAVACTAATFGSDPIPGITKSCFATYTPVSVPALAPALPAIAAPVMLAGSTATYAPALNLPGASFSWTFGDGSLATAASSSPNTSHVFSAAGLYSVKLSVRLGDGTATEKTFLQAVTTPATARGPVASSALAVETRVNAPGRVWVANPDTDTVAVIDSATNTRTAEVAVGRSPRSVAVAGDGRIWVANKDAATLSIVSPATLAVVQTVNLPAASQPHGLVVAPGGGSAYVVLEGPGQLLKLDPVTGAVQGTLNVGPNVRHVSLSGDGATVLVSRFVTPPLAGEGTATITAAAGGAEVLVVNTANMALRSTVTLRHSDKVDTEAQGAGIPNYLGAAAIAPDGRSAWVPSKQDNVLRGTLRNGKALDFQNTVRAISSRIDLTTLAEDLARRVDHDNASLGSAAAHHPSGAYLFVALETSREVAVVDPVSGRQLARLDVGRAPQALAVSADGRTLYTQNFMDRTVSVIDLTALVTVGEANLPLKATVTTVGTEKLAAQVLQGKRLFYDARDPRLARDRYMSCASCHSDAGHDGRTWDFTGFSEGLRNTPALKGRAGMGQGFAHWSANFDEIQDFEGQIRNFAGGTGLMTDAQFNTGTRNTPLGDRKTGVSADLDALAAYLASLNSVDNSPLRNPDGTLTAAAVAGRVVFTNANCASCHAGTAFSISASGSALKNIGTLKPASGQRLGAALTGLDVPTLRDVWQTAPYLHDGSAPTLAAAVQAHAGNTVAGADLGNLVAYLQQIGAQEPTAPGAADPSTSATPPPESLACANEGQVCTLPAGRTATVWYGAGSRWAQKPGVTAGIGCNNVVFGDPIPGTVKSCRYIAGGTATNAAPTVALTAPAANAGFFTAATITLAATASDSDGTVAKVEFLDGGTVVGTVAAAPWSLNWTTTTLGTHLLAARATDNSGAVTTSAAVLVNVAAPAATPPATALTCANEGGNCALPAGRAATVWYGANAQWVVRTGVVGSIACTNAVFGDPVFGTVKSCRRQ